MAAWLLFVSVFFLSGSKARAVEAPDSTGGESIAGIITETDTSIVYDMGMKPAGKQNISDVIYENPANYYSELKTPAQITQIGNDFFIVDTYHGQVLYSPDINTPIKDWKVLAGNLALPHAIAGDGTRYLVVNTEKYEVLVYERRAGRYQNTQILENIGIRPHYIQYDEMTDSFYVWSAHTGEMYILKADPATGLVCVDQIRQIKELFGYYVRSFTIVGEQILFPSGNNGYMILADKETLEVQGRYPVTEEIAGMAYVMPIGGYFYITVSTDLEFDQSRATMIRTKELANLATGEYEDIYDIFPDGGVPYYIDKIGSAYYVTNHGSKRSVWRFAANDDAVMLKGILY